jgi:hypothetical protein
MNEGFERIRKVVMVHQFNLDSSLEGMGKICVRIVVLTKIHNQAHLLHQVRSVSACTSWFGRMKV